jgi:hypothetical protein
VNSVAAQPSARPLNAEFLARVIKVEAVQCYRDAVTDDHTAHFFTEGRLPGVFGDFFWSLDEPEAFPWGLLAPATSEKPAPVSLPMQHAWDAAVIAWRTFILDVRNGDLLSKERGGKLERWTSIVLRAAIPERKLGRIDWNDWWEHEKARRQQNQLPNDKSYPREAEPLIKERYGVNLVPETELRRIKAALYRGDLERPKRKRKLNQKSKRKG